VNVTVLSTDGPTPNMHPPRVDQNGNYVIGLRLPGTTYAVQRAPSVTGPWTTLATVVVGPSGWRVCGYRSQPAESGVLPGDSTIGNQTSNGL